MRLPFISRAHHEEIVSRMRDQIRALAMRVYPDGITEEVSLLLGIPASVTPVRLEPEPELTDDQIEIARMKAEQANDWAEVQRIKRTRPSQLGPAMARHMQKWGAQRFGGSAMPADTSEPSPAIAIFQQAEAEALKTA